MKKKLTSLYQSLITTSIKILIMCEKLIATFKEIYVHVN